MITQLHFIILILLSSAAECASNNSIQNKLFIGLAIGALILSIAILVFVVCRIKRINRSSSLRDNGNRQNPTLRKKSVTMDKNPPRTSSSRAGLLPSNTGDSTLNIMGSRTITMKPEQITIEMRKKSTIKTAQSNATTQLPSSGSNKLLMVNDINTQPKLSTRVPEANSNQGFYPNTASSKSSDQHGKLSPNTTFSLKTLINTKHELSLPGFLEVRDDFDYEYTKQLKSGGGGSVYLGRATTSELMERCEEKPIVIKKIHNVEEEYVKELKLIFDQEIAMMWFFNKNQYFATILGFCPEPKCIIMKFYPMGSLYDLIFGRSRYSKRTAVWLMLDITNGLRAMHVNGFAHCDIKPDNVLLEERNGRISGLLTDFGVTQIFDNKRMLVRAFQIANIEGGSLKYAAPEVIKILRSSVELPQPAADIIKTRDVYSFGVVSFELLTRFGVNRVVKWFKKENNKY